MNLLHEIDTQLGKLVVYQNADPEYPGYSIFLVRHGKELLLSTVECGQSPYHKNPRLILAAYGDVFSEEPTYNRDIMPREIDRCFKEVFCVEVI